MLQQQINYWNLRETMRHNRVGESIYQQDADTNRMNANTNIFNANTNAINAVSNRMQANAALSQAAAAHRQASAAESQANSKAREVTVKEKTMPSEIWSNYTKSASSPLAALIKKGGKVGKTGVAPAGAMITGASAASKFGVPGLIVAGTIVDGALLNKYVYEPAKDWITSQYDSDSFVNSGQVYSINPGI